MNKARFPEDYVLGKRYDVLIKTAQDKGVSPVALVVAWLTNLYRMKDYPTVIPLFSSSGVKHFVESLSGCEMALSDEEMKTLTEA